jgi:hypothetical protein
MTDKEIAQALDVDYATFRQYKRRPFQPQSLVLTYKHKAVVDDVISNLDSCNVMKIYQSVFVSVEGID